MRVGGAVGSAVAGRVGRIVLRNPGKSNAITLEVYREIPGAVAAAAAAGVGGTRGDHGLGTKRPIILRQTAAAHVGADPPPGAGRTVITAYARAQQIFARVPRISDYATFASCTITVQLVVEAKFEAASRGQ